MPLEFPSMIDFGLARTADVLTRAFEDYFVRIPFSAASLVQAARMDSVDLTLSRVFLRDGIAVGGALIARRGWNTRLAGMAIVAGERRAGIGRAAMDQLLAEAKARGDRTMFLEVIEQNQPAVNLYRSCGFREMRRLIGFSGPPPPVTAAESVELTEIHLREAAEAVIRYGLPDLPWQLSGETLAQLTPPSIAYRMDGAWIVLSNPSEPAVSVRGIVAEPAAKGREATLLQAVMARHPGRTQWRLSAVWPEEWAEILAPAGLPRCDLTQWQMRQEL